MENIEIMELLVASGADINTYNWCGETSMGHAIQEDKVDAFKVLLSLGGRKHPSN